MSLTLGSSGLVDYQLVTSLLIGALVATPIGMRLLSFPENLIKRVLCTYRHRIDGLSH